MSKMDVTFKDVTLRFKNFSGRETDFNAEGNRNFHVDLTEDMVEYLNNVELTTKSGRTVKGANVKVNKLNNIQQPITRNRITTSNNNSKTIINNLFNHQKRTSQPSNNININININNSNKIIYNKIIEMTNKNTITKKRGKLSFF